MTLDDVRELALSLPRSYEAVVRGRVKFRVGQIVYLAFSHDGETMGFGFPKEWRDALVQSEAHKFSLPSQSDMRFNWVHVRLAAIDADEMRDLVEGAWAMCVPKRVAAEYAASQGYRGRMLRQALMPSIGCPMAQNQSPNQRARLVAPNSSFSAA